LRSSISVSPEPGWPGSPMICSVSISLSRGRLLSEDEGLDGFDMRTLTELCIDLYQEARSDRGAVRLPEVRSGYASDGQRLPALPDDPHTGEGSLAQREPAPLDRQGGCPVAARQHLIRSLLCDSDRLSYAFSVADGQAYVGHDLSDIKVEKCTICQASLVSCSTCGSQWCLDHTPNPLVCPGCGARS
jgi:hypothetical protein